MAWSHCMVLLYDIYLKNFETQDAQFMVTLTEGYIYIKDILMYVVMYVHVFFEILKRTLQNFKKITNKCFLVTGSR